MIFDKYEEALHFLYDQLPMFSKQGADAYKPGFERIKKLCDLINNPQLNLKFIHIGGTNGKGSTSHMLAACLQKAGYKVGLYTSPHLFDFGERIKTNGIFIDKNFLLNFVNKLYPQIIEIKPSFFELTVALAFDYFNSEKVDYAIIEVGLGGRLDSTNIIKPILSIITNISYDHQNILGNTLPEIAIEKAGIIKDNTPIIINEKQDAIKQIFIDRANIKKAPIYFANEIINIKNNDGELFINEIKIEPDLKSNYQLKNIIGVWQALILLEKIGLNNLIINAPEALKKVIELTNFKGRWQTLNQFPKVIADVAHNEAGMIEILDQIASEKIKGKIIMIIGMVKDKDISKVLSILPKNFEYIFTNAHIPRALNCNELLQKANDIGLQGFAFDDINAAYNYAINTFIENDFVMICGSVFLLGELNILNN